MKPQIHVLLSALLFCTYLSFSTTDPKNDTKKVDDLNRSGYAFSVSNIAKVNSRFSEVASAVFKNKLIIVSSKKIGIAGSGFDKNTNEPYTDLFCADIKSKGELSYPLLFSRILNTKANEGQVSFSPDEQTIYYTRSKKDCLNYKLYMAQLEKDSHGKWINEMELAISSDEYSIENPHVTADGKYLYFSSNMEGGFGGFDIYRAEIFNDGGLRNIENLGSDVNTPQDEKYPHVSKNGKELYFSSNGFNSLGGYDIFISNINDKTYSLPRNLGENINSNKDEIGFMFIDENRGVFSSNKGNKKNNYNMYRFYSEAIYQNLEGTIISEDGNAITNTTIILLDSNGNEVARQITSNDASYSFKIRPFENYEIKVEKEGFENYSATFQSKDTKIDIAFEEVLKLSSKVSLNKMKP